MSQSLRLMVDAVHAFLSELPQVDASPRVRANFLAYKGEVFDLLAGLSDHDQYTQLRAIANHARHEARTLMVQF
ncbi:hypothetical protein DMC64_34530 [Amycolatopsis sp. WAC 04197]|uniref:hypothetical protein n=1 Tax=Amycolatopsis sp. WAC 04197 TaxID=2203199 RepID=UPI000F7BA9E2|nr:hypothetical protein [Amycolatopsis sp. WAC 04197]RSN40053.1 hypothetical protein DMC64_34530 [Amycolatopsis sp. WAC 04197]